MISCSLCILICSYFNRNDLEVVNSGDAVVLEIQQPKVRFVVHQRTHLAEQLTSERCAFVCLFICVFCPFVRPSVFSSGYSAVQPAVLCNQLFISQLSNQLCNRLRSVLSAAKTMGFFVIPAIYSSEPWFRWLLLERKKTDLLHARAQFT